MSNWVEEFNDFAGGTGAAEYGAVSTGGGMKSTFVPHKPSRQEKLKAELKLLEWHKLANDAALKAALMHTKNIHEPGPHRSKPFDEEAKRIRKIITNEQTKPLEVTRDFVLKYEEKERIDSEHLTQQVERHIDTLRTIRSKLEERVELKSRIGDYRDWKREFMEKKNAVMSGKTLKDVSKETTQVQESSSKPPPAGGRDLATVLDSLNKLAQLEQRITSLERDSENLFDKMRENEGPNVHFEAQKTAIDFKKKRAPDPLAAASGKPGGLRTVYAVRAKKVPMSKGVRLPIRQGGGKGGVFLTSVEDNNRDARARERQRQLALASAGQKNLRERVRTKKTRQLDDLNSHTKHEQALADLNRRRSEQAARMKAKRTEAITGKGASSGRKYKNQHLEEFQKMKKAHRDKKETRKGIGTTRQSASAQPTTNKYVSSSTMPVISKPSSRAPRGAPATKTAGTVTRRVNTVPNRGGKANTKMPAIVVAGSGVGGVRGLKQQRLQK